MLPADRDPKHADRRFVFQRDRTWKSLTRTADSNVRHCGTCDRNVHLCATEREAVMHAILLPRTAGAPTSFAIGRFDAGIPTTAWLYVLDGRDAGRTIRLPRPPFTLGRGPADVVLDDDSLDPVRLVFEDKGGGLEAHDARQPPASAERAASVVRLHDGLQFRIGRTLLVFKSSEG